MKIKIYGLIAIGMIWGGLNARGAASGFEKVRGHCYYMQLPSGNVSIVVTNDGVLMVNPPRDADLAAVTEALARVTAKPVRWLAFTDPRYARTAGARHFAAQGAQPLADVRQWDMAAPPQDSAWLVFDSQLRLYPAGLEVQIFAVRHKATTAGDIVAYVPAEKVLMVGDLYESARYPEIDAALEGSAVGWLDGVAHVIGAIPVRKAAIARKKAAAEPQKEGTLEEEILVVSAHDRVSNLQNMKDLLEGSQKLRSAIQKAIRAGRSADRFLELPASDPYRSYGNLTPYAQQLFQALAEDR